MVILKILTDLLCGVLFWVGGKWWHDARRFVMPLLLGITCAIITKTWWLIPAIFVPMAACLCIGYGEDSLFYKIFGDKWGRGVWGLLVGFAASAFLFFFGFMALYWWIPYLILSFFMEPMLKDLNQDIGDPLIGIGYGLLVFLI